MFDIIAFDADDTLWDNETFYIQAKEQFIEKVSVYVADKEVISRRLDEIEEGNVSAYGYGIKSFTLSMVEAAIEISQGEVSAEDLQGIINLGRHMLSTPVRPFPDTEEVLAKLATEWELMLITKGDVFEQSKKIDRTGLLKYFRLVEIVGVKTTAVYRSLLERHHLEAQRFLMVGNSLRSDILPVLELGGKAVYIPYEHTWSHEHIADEFVPQDGYYQLENLAELPNLLENLAA